MVSEHVDSLAKDTTRTLVSVYNRYGCWPPIPEFHQLVTRKVVCDELEKENNLTDEFVLLWISAANEYINEVLF